MSASVNQIASGSRSRPQARKKVNDDAAYFGPPSGSGVTGTKRQATDKADGDLNRAKRKRVETTHSTMTNGKKDAPDPDKQPLDFCKLPTSKLYRYLIQFDIVPSVHPSPLSPEDPPPPSSLADPQRQHSRPPSPPALTPANRPRRDPKDSVSRRRSSRLLEEEVRSRTPILSDVQELHGVLAAMVDQHFKEKTSMNGREEVDTLAAFMCKVEGPDYRFAVTRQLRVYALKIRAYGHFGITQDVDIKISTAQDWLSESLLLAGRWRHLQQLSCCTTCAINNFSHSMRTVLNL